MGKATRARGDAAGQVAEWWTRALVGLERQPHPFYGEAVEAKLHGGVLRLSGALDSARERHELISEAQGYVGRGIDDVDARRLIVKPRDQQRGLLDQTIMAAYANPALASYARTFLGDHRRLKPKELDVVTADRDPRLERIGELARGVRKAMAAGQGIVLVRVDEVDAFEARELLDEDTCSLWTLAMPPVPAKRSR